MLSPVLLAAAAGGLSSCELSDYSGLCSDDLDCDLDDRIGVICMNYGANKYCAYRVYSCPTGLRWQDSAPKNVRGNCVTPDMLGADGGSDAGAADGPPIP